MHFRRLAKDLSVLAAVLMLLFTAGPIGTATYADEKRIVKRQLRQIKIFRN